MLELCCKEARQLWREQRLPALYLLLALALVCALSGTLRANRLESRQSAQAADAEYQRWLNQGEKYAHTAAHYGIYVFRPVYGLANLDPGVQAFVGHSVWLEAHVQNGLLYRPLEDGTAVERLGALTPVFLLTTLLPLFILLLAHGSFTVERERGTLKLVLIHSSGIGRLVLSKLLVQLVASALPVIVVFGITAGCALMWHMAEPPDALIRWCLLLLVSLSPVLLWSLLSLGVSSLMRTSGQALATLLTLWCVMCLVLPRAVAELAERRHPAPTQLRLAASMTAALGDVEGGDRESAVKQRLLAQYHVDSLEKLPVNWEGVMRNEGEAAGDGVFDRFWGALFSSYRMQQGTVARFAMLSSSLASTWLSGRLASTDIDAHLDFVEAAEAHRRSLEATLNDQIVRKLADPKVLRPNSGREVWSRVPRFRFGGYPLSHVEAGEGHATLLALAALLTQLVFGTLLLAAGARRLSESGA